MICCADVPEQPGPHMESRDDKIIAEAMRGTAKANRIPDSLEKLFAGCRTKSIPR